MYPNLYYVLKDWFGVEWNWTRLINMFGFFVAIAFITAAFVITRELKRKEREGLLHPVEETIEVGKPAGVGELLINFLIGFVFGLKLGGLILMGSVVFQEPQAFILSGQGSIIGGLILGGFMAWLKWNEKHKQQLAKPEERKVRIYPHDRVGDMIIMAVIFGFLGAKIFHNLENWDDFVQDPVGALLSFSGLTFYGGLIVAGLAVYRYARKHKIGFKFLLDAFAPTMMVAYAIGRIGCQVAGDGDWGIINSAYTSTLEGKVILSDSVALQDGLHRNAAFYNAQFGSLEQVHHKSVVAPSFLPTWMVAYNYPHNVLSEGIRFQGCNGQYCSYLPLPVFPTPFYETVLCLILFGILMVIKKKITAPGALFGIYLIMNGVERFLVETIRVNTKYHLLGLQPTQAELISSSLVVAGIILLVYTTRKANNQLKPAEPVE